MDHFLSFLRQPVRVHALIIGAVTLYWGLRVFAFSGLSGDEAEQVLYAQAFAWGYDVANPPLYTWALMGLFNIFGKSAAVVLAFKLAVLGGLYVALYHAARLILGPGKALDWALVGLSPVLMFPIGWHAMFSYSHSLLNALFVILAVVAVWRIVHRGRTWDFLGLGIVVGLGVMSKYSFVLFLAALLAATASVADIRTKVFTPKLALSVLVAALIALPHALWLLDAREVLQSAVNYKLQVQEETSYLTGLGKGLWNLMRAAFAFLSPYWLIALAVFPILVRGFKTPSANVWGTLLGRTFAGVFALLAVMVLSGATQFRPNYMFFLILVPLWAFTRLPVSEKNDKRRIAYGVIAAAGLVVSVGSLAAKAVSDPYLCKKCQQQMPYERIAQELKDRDFTGGSVLAHWYPNPLPGNLLLFLDDARMVSTKFPHLIPTHGASDGQSSGKCLLVTMAVDQGGSDMVNLSARAKEAYGATVDPKTPFTRFEVPFRGMPDKWVLVDYVLLDAENGQNLGDCR